MCIFFAEKCVFLTIYLDFVYLTFLLMVFGGNMCIFLVVKCVHFGWLNVYIFGGKMCIFFSEI